MVLDVGDCKGQYIREIRCVELGLKNDLKKVPVTFSKATVTFRKVTVTFLDGFCGQPLGRRSFA